MKTHSDNVRVRGGIVAINNLNTFVDEKVAGADLASFQEAMRRSAFLAERAVRMRDDEENPFARAFLSLAELSIPIVRVVRHQHYMLEQGILLWADRFFEPGAEFYFDLNGDLKVVSEDKVSAALAPAADFREAHYDTYNANALSTISPEVLKELDVAIDPKDYEGAHLVDMDDVLVAVKYMSVYVRSMEPNLNVRIFAVQIGRAEGETEEEAAYNSRYLYQDIPGIDFDHAMYDICASAGYDQYLVEFVDASQPFAYIGTEIGGIPENPGDEPPEIWEMSDIYGLKHVDKDHIDQMRRLDVDGDGLLKAVEVLRQIGEGL